MFAVFACERLWYDHARDPKGDAVNGNERRVYVWALSLMSGRALIHDVDRLLLCWPFTAHNFISSCPRRCLYMPLCGFGRGPSGGLWNECEIADVSADLMGAASVVCENKTFYENDGEFDFAMLCSHLDDYDCCYKERIKTFVWGHKLAHLLLTQVEREKMEAFSDRQSNLRHTGGPTRLEKIDAGNLMLQASAAHCRKPIAYKARAVACGSLRTLSETTACTQALLAVYAADKCQDEMKEDILKCYYYCSSYLLHFTREQKHEMLRGHLGFGWSIFLSVAVYVLLLVAAQLIIKRCRRGQFPTPP